jgi:hypothetical protein
MGHAAIFLFTIALLLPSHVDVIDIRQTLSKLLAMLEDTTPSTNYATPIRNLLGKIDCLVNLRTTHAGLSGPFLPSGDGFRSAMQQGECQLPTMATAGAPRDEGYQGMGSSPEIARSTGLPSHSPLAGFGPAALPHSNQTQSQSALPDPSGQPPLQHQQRNDVPAFQIAGGGQRYQGKDGGVVSEEPGGGDAAVSSQGMGQVLDHDAQLSLAALMGEAGFWAEVVPSVPAGVSLLPS